MSDSFDTLYLQSTVIGGTSTAATWSERGKVHIWDLSKPLHAVNDSVAMKEFLQISDSLGPMFTFSGHQVEGYAMDWSSTVQGYYSFAYGPSTND